MGRGGEGGEQSGKGDAGEEIKEERHVGRKERNEKPRWKDGTKYITIPRKTRNFQAPISCSLPSARRRLQVLVSVIINDPISPSHSSAMAKRKVQQVVKQVYQTQRSVDGHTPIRTLPLTDALARLKGGLGSVAVPELKKLEIRYYRNNSAPGVK